MELLDHKAEREGLTEVDPAGQNTWSAGDVAIGDRGAAPGYAVATLGSSEERCGDKRRVTIFTYAHLFCL